jgi:hypothetical protein
LTNLLEPTSQSLRRSLLLLLIQFLTINNSDLFDFLFVDVVAFLPSQVTNSWLWVLLNVLQWVSLQLFFLGCKYKIFYHECLWFKVLLM